MILKKYNKEGMKFFLLIFILISILTLSSCSNKVIVEKPEIDIEYESYNIKINCIDNDLKKQIKRKPETDPLYNKDFAQQGEERLDDRCYDENLLLEAECSSSNGLIYSNQTCECGCVDGACRFKPKLVYFLKRRLCLLEIKMIILLFGR